MMRIIRMTKREKKWKKKRDEVKPVTKMKFNGRQQKILQNVFRFFLLLLLFFALILCSMFCGKDEARVSVFD